MGAGFVGVTTAVVLAEQGHRITIIEPSQTRCALLSAGQVPFFEPGLQAAYTAVAERVSVASSTSSIGQPEIVFLCVGTPSRENGSTDFTQIQAAIEDLASYSWETAPVFVIKSTVPPGTTRGLVQERLAGRLGAPGQEFGLAMNPEFLREGSALHDARHPDRIVCGVLDELAAEKLKELFTNQSCPIRITSLETAELCKYAANALLATKIGFANELARLAERVGTDIDAVFETVGLDHRIAPAFLQAGPGFGGSCFPKDLKSLAATARSLGVNLGIVDAVLNSNESQPEHIVALIQGCLGNLKNKHITLLGASFKPETDDIRETRTLPVQRLLEARGATVAIHDPKASASYMVLSSGQATDDLEAAVAGADAIVLMTHWSIYQSMDANDIGKLMRQRVLIDTRRYLDERPWRLAGFRVTALGRAGNIPIHEPHTAHRARPVQWETAP